MKEYSIKDIAKNISGRIVGEHSLKIRKVEHVRYAQKGHITFIGHKNYLKNWENSEASAAIINDSFLVEPISGKAIVFVQNVDVALLNVLKMFEPPPPEYAYGIHSKSFIHKKAFTGKNVNISPGCYIGPGARINDNCILYPNVTILDNTIIGDNTVIWPGVVIRERCIIGRNCIIHSNSTIGTDGFGYIPSNDEKRISKIPQIDIVTIGDDVEIGSGTCIDRGKHTATEIGKGTKIDNLVQIGHNCKIGNFCIISGTTGIAGSVVLGNGVTIGGGVGIKDNINIGDGARIAAGSNVSNDIKPGMDVSGTPAHEHRHNLKEWSAIRRLPGLIKKMRKFENKLKDINEN